VKERGVGNWTRLEKGSALYNVVGSIQSFTWLSFVNFKAMMASFWTDRDGNVTFHLDKDSW